MAASGDADDESDLLCRGAACSIRFARPANASLPAKEFLLGSEIDPQDLARLQRLFERLAGAGRISNTQKFRKERGEIWGFKGHQARVGAFRSGNDWFLTHGFVKKRDAWPSTELDRAERIMTEHRINGGAFDGRRKRVDEPPGSNRARTNSA